MLKLRTFLLFAVLCSLVQLSRAQFDSHSPYSYYGIGSPVSNTLQNGFAMGGVAHALKDSCFLNPINPASYSSLDVTQLVFGFEGNFLTRNDGGQTLHNNNVFINQFGLGIPIMHKHQFVNWGMFLGYSPFSHVGYRISETNTVVNGSDTIEAKSSYTGAGGLNKVTWGNGFQLGKNFSLGFNLHYLFGTSNRIRVLELPISMGYLSSRVEEKTTVNSVSFDAGIQAFFPFNVKKNIKNDSIRKYQFVFGATYRYGGSFEADFSQLGIQYPATASAVDTFLLNPDSKGNISMPHSFGTGVLLTNTTVWKLAFDFNYTLWSGFKYFDQPSLSLNDSYSFHLGTEYTPKYAQKSNEKRSSEFFKNIRYRAGVRYYNRFYRPDSNPVDEIAFSAGFGLPFGFDVKWQEESGKRITTLSYVNLGFEGGVANSRNGGLVNESFFRFTVSLTLRDKWFKKFKYY
jgi:hypothetical protein